MKHFVWPFLAAAMFAGCSRKSTPINDPAVQAIVSAQQSLLGAATCRVTILQTYARSAQRNEKIIERVGEGILHVRSAANGIQNLEMITDGKRQFLYENDRFVEERGDAAATLKSFLRDGSLDALVKDSESGKTVFLNEALAEGESTRVYLVEARERDVATATKVWIKKSDGRPLKMESGLWHLSLNRGQTDQNPDMTFLTTYTYDSSTRIKLPGT